MNFFKCLWQVYLTCVLVVFALNGCGKHDAGIWKNKKIDAGVREAFKEKNDLLFEALKTNRPEMLEKILSGKMLEDPNRFRTIELSSIRMKGGQVNLLDEYYLVHDFNKPAVVQSANHGLNTYTLNYTPTTREMYVCMYEVKIKDNKWLLSAVYNKLDYGWKLCELELNPYTIMGKTSPELYAQAKKQYARGYLIDAV